MNNHPNPNQWWKHRRRGYYISLIWAIVQTFLWALLEYFMPGSVQSLSSVVGWSYGLASTVILGYYGNTAIQTYLENKGLNK